MNNHISQFKEHLLSPYLQSVKDPIPVLIEKLSIGKDILVKVSDKNNCEQILLELKEYSSDVDMELVGAAIKAIG